MDLKVLLVVLSLAAVSLAAGPNADVKAQSYNVRTPKYSLKQGSTGQSQDAVEILSRWCKSSQMSQDAITQSFKHLVETLKQMPTGQLEQLTQQVVISERICQQQGTNNKGQQQQQQDAGSEDLVKDVYMDALMGAETRETMKQLVHCIDSGKVDKIRANFYLTRLALADEDTVKESVAADLVQSFTSKRLTGKDSSSSSMSRELAEAIERQKMFATTATLARQLKSKSNNKNGKTNIVEIERMAEQVVKTIAERYIYSNKQQQQQQLSSEEKAERNAALKAIANIPSAYYPKEIVQLLMKLASQKDEQSTVRQTAIEALEECDDARQFVKRLMKDEQEPTEVRIAAYRCLMTMAKITAQDIDELVQLVSDSQRQSRDKQFIMYVLSHLNNMRTSNNKDQEQIVEILRANKQHYMAIQLLAKKFKHMQDVRKYSRNFQLEQTVAKIDSGFILDSDLIYADSRESKREFLPKLLRVNVSMPVFGKNVNVMEISVRQDNMDEQLIRSMPDLTQIKDAKLGVESIERIVDTIKQVANEQQQQQQQKKQQHGNNNNNNKKQQQQDDDDEAEADLSIKVDGCTVLYVSLDDFKTEQQQQQQRERRSINGQRQSSAFEDILEAMKSNFAFNRGAHFAINKRLAGVLDLEAVLSGVLRAESRVRQISSDSFEIAAHLQPRFALEAIVGPSTMSKRLLQRVSTESSIGLRMKYSRSELVEIQIDLPMNEMELFKIQSEIVEQTRSGSYKYTRPSLNKFAQKQQQQQEEDQDDDVEYDIYGDNKFNKWSLKSLQRSSYQQQSFEMPSQIVRALGLDGKIELVYSPKDLTYLARCVVSKSETSVQGYRFQIQSQKSNNKQQQQYAIIVSAPGSQQVDRTIQMRVQKQQTQAGRVTLKVDLISSFAAGSAQLELVKDERQMALRLETISRQSGKAAKFEAGLQQAQPSMNGKKSISYKPYMTIVMPNEQPMRFEGLISVQQGAKTVVAYEFKMPEQLFGRQAQGQAQFVRGKIIADYDDSETTSTAGRTTGGQRRYQNQNQRDMQSALERVLNQDVTISSETVAQLGSLAIKVHSMMESKAEEMIGFELNTQYQLGPHKRQESSKFAAKLHYQAPEQQQKLGAQRQSLYLEHSCTEHPEHAFLVQLTQAYKPYEQHDLSINVHYPNGEKKFTTTTVAGNKQQQKDEQETIAYSHSIKYNKQQQVVECLFAAEATPLDFEREAKLLVQVLSGKRQLGGKFTPQQRNSRMQQAAQKDQQQFNNNNNKQQSIKSVEAQFVVVDKITKSTPIEARLEMSQQDKEENVVALLKLNDGKHQRQYRLAHQARRDQQDKEQQKQSGKQYKSQNKLQLDLNGQQTTFDYVVRVEQSARGVYDIIIDGGARTPYTNEIVKIESKTRVQHGREIAFEHKTVASNDYRFECVCKPQQGQYKLIHESPEWTMDMMARVQPSQEPLKLVQWQIKERRGQFVHQTKLAVDEREAKLIVQSQQTGRQAYKIDSLIYLTGFESSSKKQTSFIQAVWEQERSKLNVEYQSAERFLCQWSSPRYQHKTLVQSQRKQQLTVESRTEKDSQLECEIQGELSMARQGRSQMSIDIPRLYSIKMECTNNGQGYPCQQVRASINKGVEHKKQQQQQKSYDNINMMYDASAWPNTKFETDATDYQGRRSSLAADMWVRQEKPSTFAMQTPSYAAQSELVYGHEQGLRCKSSLKDLNRNERYEMDANIARGRRSHFKFDGPEHKSAAYYEPEAESGEFMYEDRRQSSPWSFTTKFDSQRDQQQQSSPKSKLGRYIRRAFVQYNDQHEQQGHSIEFTPSSENVKFMSERRFKQSTADSNNNKWWKMHGELSSYRKPEQRDQFTSSLQLESADYDADLNVKPFGDNARAAWKVRARRSVNEGELSEICDDIKQNVEHKGKTYKAVMKHLTNKELKALVEAQCSRNNEHCKAKIHAPGKFSSRYEHDFDYQNNNEQSMKKQQHEQSRKSKFDFEFDAPSHKFNHMSSFEMERPQSWRHKRSVHQDTDESQRFFGLFDQSSYGFDKLNEMDARIQSRTLYRDNELYNIDGQLNNLYNSRQRQQQFAAKKTTEQHDELSQYRPSSLKFNARQWRSDMQYQPESHAQFELVTPEQERHVARFEPMRQQLDMLKLSTKSYNKRGQQQYQLQGEFPSRYLLAAESTKDSKRDYEPSTYTKFDYQDDSYKAGFDFDLDQFNGQYNGQYNGQSNKQQQQQQQQQMRPISWYMKNDKTGFEHNTKLTLDTLFGQQQQWASSNNKNSQKVLTTVTKSARFGTLAAAEITVNPQDQSMEIVVDSALVKGKITGQYQGEEKVIKMRFESTDKFSQANQHELRQLLRELFGAESKQIVDMIEKLAKKLVKPFVHETTVVINEREQSYKIQTKVERQQEKVLEATATVHMGQHQTVARVESRRGSLDIVADHVTGACQIRATGQTYQGKKPFTHETVIERIDQHQYSVQSRTTYKQDELVKLVGRVSIDSIESIVECITEKRCKNLSSKDSQVSQIEATILNKEYRLMAQLSGEQLKVIVQDDKRQLVHEKQFHFDGERQRVQFQCRTTDNKHAQSVVYQAQGVVCFDERSNEVSHIVIETPAKAQLIKAQYVPKKELLVTVDGQQMQHMTKIEMPQSQGQSTPFAKAIKQLKMRSYHKCPKVSYEVDADIDADRDVYQVQAKCFDSQKDRALFELTGKSQPELRSFAQYKSRTTDVTINADHKAERVELVYECNDNKNKCYHQTVIQKIANNDYTFRSVTNKKNVELAKIVGRVSTDAKRVAPIAELEATLNNQQYKVSGKAAQITGTKQYKVQVAVEDTKRHQLSQSQIVYDEQRDQVEFQSRLGDKYQPSAIVYQAQGRICLNEDDEKVSEIKYQSQESQFNVEYKPKKEMTIELETPELKHSTSIDLPSTQVPSKTSWNQALKQMQLRSQSNATLRGSPIKKFSYNFGADFDVNRKPSIVAYKLH